MSPGLPRLMTHMWPACAWPRAPTSCLGPEGEDPPPACCLDWTILGRGIRGRVLGLGLGLVAGERQALDRCQGPFQQPALLPPPSDHLLRPDCARHPVSRSVSSVVPPHFPVSGGRRGASSPRAGAPPACRGGTRPPLASTSCPPHSLPRPRSASRVRSCSRHRHPRPCRHPSCSDGPSGPPRLPGSQSELP